MARREEWAVTVKCNADEERLIKSAADAAGIGWTPWARRALLDAARVGTTTQARFHASLIAAFDKIREQDGELAERLLRFSLRLADDVDATVPLREILVLHPDGPLDQRLTRAVLPGCYPTEKQGLSFRLE